MKGRKIQDNIIITHEMFHHLKLNQRSGETRRKIDCALKLDMQKAYDRVK